MDKEQHTLSRLLTRARRLKEEAEAGFGAPPLMGVKSQVLTPENERFGVYRTLIPCNVPSWLYYVFAIMVLLSLLACGGGWLASVDSIILGYDGFSFDDDSIRLGVMVVAFCEL